jgi:hypothetical protein
LKIRENKMRITYYKKDVNSDEQITSISGAKKLLKAQGGSAWTEHYDRDGSMFERTLIEVKGSNSRFKYNKHL